MEYSDKDTITLTRSLYEELTEKAVKWEALESFGVDNWHGYDEAMSSIDDDEENE